MRIISEKLKREEKRKQVTELVRTSLLINEEKRHW